MNSRAKGKAGELELAAFLRDHGFEARRGQQFAGGGDSPDIVSSLPGFHIECKRVESGNLYVWMDQAMRDTPGAHIPVVMHRRSRKEWVAILPLPQFLKLVKKAYPDA